MANSPFDSCDTCDLAKLYIKGGAQETWIGAGVVRRMARDQDAWDHTGEGIHQPESLNGIDRAKADTKN